MPFHVADDGCRIFWQQTGEGAPCLLIPGLGGEGAFWQGVVGKLEAGFGLIRIDHRGAGASDRPAEGYSLPRIARDILGVLDEIGIENAHVVGHSTGGMIAQILAVTAPERVRSLVLSGTWGKVDLRFRRLFEARLALLEKAGPQAYHKLTQALGYDPDWMEAHRDLLDREVATAQERLRDSDIQAARIRMLMEHDVHEHLGRIAMPTLVLGARDDALIPYQSSEALANEIPGACLVALSGGHFFPKAYPEAYAAEVARFLEGAAS